MNKRVKAIAAAAAIIAGMTGAGFAYAAFTEDTAATANDGQAANMQPLTLVGAPATNFDNTQGLYPGHSANVTIVVHNPNAVDVDVTSVVPAASGSKNVTGGTTPNDASTRAYCEGKLSLAATPGVTGNGTNGGLRVPAGADVTLVLANAVSLASDTDNRCQGMAFTTVWTAQSANT